MIAFLLGLQNLLLPKSAPLKLQDLLEYVAMVVKVLAAFLFIMLWVVGSSRHVPTGSDQPHSRQERVTSLRDEIENWLYPDNKIKERPPVKKFKPQNNDLPFSRKKALTFSEE